MLLDKLPIKEACSAVMMNLPSDLVQEVKKLAKENSLTMTDVARAGFETFVQEMRSRGKLKQTKFEFVK